MAQKKHLDALRAKQKTWALYDVQFPTNQEKPTQRVWFFFKLQFFHSFSKQNSSKTVFFISLRFFCIAFSASRRFYLAIIFMYRTIFHISYPKGGPFWFRGAQSFTYMTKDSWIQRTKNCFETSEWSRAKLSWKSLHNLSWEGEQL